MVAKSRDPADLITCQQLKDRLEYNPETGDFVWLVKPRGSECGTVAGKLNSNKYLQVWLLNKRYLLHRLAFLYMTGSHPDDEVDHIDGSRTNNSWANLRSVTPAENSRNRKRGINNSSGAMGVRYDRKTGEWLVSIRVDGKLKSLGSFSHKFFARQARLAAEKKYGYHENHGKR